jgi:CRP/FNR family transcriptional regulator, nitrogen fixation regulation protein
MFKQFAPTGLGEVDRASPAGTESGALLALERIGARRSFIRNAEIYAEGDTPNSWFRVVSGLVRICKLLHDGRRHIAEFCFAGDCFGFDSGAERAFSAEAVSDLVLMRYPLPAVKRLIDESPRLACHVCEMTLRDLAHAQSRTLLLGRMTAPERVATFLLEMSDRRDAQRTLELPMQRTDIADYLGLTIETVCRTLAAFKRAGAIAIPNAHHIEFRDRRALEAACQA